MDVEAIESASRIIIDQINKAADEIRQNNGVHRPLTASFRKTKPKGNAEIVDVAKENMLTRLVEVGHYGVGTVFGLGEQMEDRLVIAKTNVECLIIPRYWLLQQEQNLGNVWQR